jgi:hypothetical protein
LGFEAGHNSFRWVKTILGDLWLFTMRPTDVMGLSKPTAVAVWRSSDVAGIGFPTASSLWQSGLHLGSLVWRCGSGARRSKAPKIRRFSDRGWAIPDRRSGDRSGLEAGVCLIFGWIRCN